MHSLVIVDSGIIMPVGITTFSESRRIHLFVTKV